MKWNVVSLPHFDSGSYMSMSAQEGLRLAYLKLVEAHKLMDEACELINQGLAFLNQKSQPLKGCQKP